MMPLNSIAIPAPAINQSAMSGGFWEGISDGLSSGLNAYLQYEQIQAVKDSGGLGQKELTTTVETTNPNSDQTFVSPAEQLKKQMGKGLQIGTGTLAAVVGGIAVLYWLSRK